MVEDKPRSQIMYLPRDLIRSKYQTPERGYFIGEVFCFLFWWMHVYSSSGGGHYFGGGKLCGGGVFTLWPAGWVSQVPSPDGCGSDPVAPESHCGQTIARPWWIWIVSECTCDPSNMSGWFFFVKKPNAGVLCSFCLNLFEHGSMEAWQPFCLHNNFTAKTFKYYQLKCWKGYFRLTSKPLPEHFEVSIVIWKNIQKNYQWVSQSFCTRRGGGGGCDWV